MNSLTFAAGFCFKRQVSCRKQAIIISTAITFSTYLVTMTINSNSPVVEAFQQEPPKVNESSSKTPIKHLIVIMQGGRGFDHYFGISFNLFCSSQVI